ncbi:MAG: bifunctional DNA primase/polymerase [Actinomycetota bacterium]|nr:bifunctional DNA primase/polymerase [Actinomycetota bacterium]
MATNELLDAAVDYAARGWRVFPLHGIVNGCCTCGRKCSSPGKHPLVRRGVHDATSDTGAIQEWWRRWRSANVAVATGEGCGLVVVDVDLPQASPSLDVIIHKVPKTRIALTGGGGIHLLLRAPGERSLHNHASRLPGIGDLPGVDLRADGGYVVAPPSLHASGNRYSWLDETAPIAAAPEWLRERRRRAVTAVPPSPPAFTTGDGSAYGRSVLRGELDRLRTAPKGRRNHTLNRAAFAVARVVAGGELLEAPARSALVSAATAIGLTAHESNLTIDSAFAAGARRPRRAPHRGS